MNLSEYTCREFTDAVGSRKPVPGGGGVSALAGALGIALGNMVGCLTTGKKKYADVEEDIRNLMKKAEQLQAEFLRLIDKDAEGFKPLSEAYKMPSSTEEERNFKEKVMENALVRACDAPLEMMRKCSEAIDVIGEFAEKGSNLAVSDAGAGAILCKSALQSASLNVFINTRDMKDRATAGKLKDEAETLLRTYTVKADEIYGRVYCQLNK